MVKKSEGRKEEPKEEQGEKRDISRIWGDSYSAIAKSGGDSYINVYKPWIESTERFIEKAVEISKDIYSDKYKGFFDEWESLQIMGCRVGREFP